MQHLKIHPAIQIGETGACTPWGHIRPPLAVDHRMQFMDQRIS